MQRAVFGILRDERVAIEVVERLKSAGFSANDVSVLLADQSGTRDFAHDQATKAPEGAATGAATGGLLGGVAGWLVGIGTLAIPGLGPFIAAGPILAAMSGAAAGAAVGGLSGALIGLGIPEYEAKQYEGKLREGNVLVSIHTENAEQRRLAKEILEHAGAEGVRVTGEESVDDDRDRDLHRNREAGDLRRMGPG
jgi:uncharacterized membrane protein